MMGETKPGADELRVRGLLRKLEVGPDADLPNTPPGDLPDGYKPGRKLDWFDELIAYNAPPASGPVALAAEPEPADEEREAEPKPTKKPAKKKRSKKKRRAAHPAWDASPRQSLLDAYDRIPPRIRWLIYHTAAAGAGWRLGWVDWSTNTAAWYTAGHWTTPTAFVLYGLAICAYALHRRTRGALWPIAWACAVPASSIVVGVLLYAPTR